MTRMVIPSPISSGGMSYGDEPIISSSMLSRRSKDHIVMAAYRVDD
ncbi:MAG: hypothetical protein V8S92_01605 [Oscillospiraceae bacterium]